eukprot:TRINITY_DN30180_c0_g1_i1.p1 TRINITY_DN30180_c0_g1~~TRINITY_DN30180_c0_g1_i1.p1  ORF type:complete len:442 (+),score=42.91 TRINITY_DN30180_c0_g1_i1:124-1449(+)
MSTSTGHTQYIVSWGSNSNGQLGLGHTDDVMSPSLALTVEKDPVRSISCGGNHTVILLLSGRILSTGRGSEGQCGRSCGEINETFSEVIGLPEEEEIIQVYAAWHSSFAVTRSGHLYHWGSPQVLGNSNKVGSHIPRRVTHAPPNITQVSARWKHVAVLTKDGKVWTCGNGRHGQLGLGDTKDRTEFCRVEDLPSGKSIVRVGCGWWHTCCQTNEGTIYVWGRGRHGQFGPKWQEDHSNIPIRVFLPCPLQTFRTGWTHIAGVDHGRNIWVWGRGDYGQTCGRGNTSEPTLVLASPPPSSTLPSTTSVSGSSESNTGAKGNNAAAADAASEPRTSAVLTVASPIVLTPDVVGLASGSEHVLALCEDGTLYGWGWGEHGQIGIDNTDNIHTPQRVNFEAVSQTAGDSSHEGQVKCTAVYAGSGHSFAVLQASGQPNVAVSEG